MMRFFKVFPSEGASVEAARRSSILRGAGVATPAARPVGRTVEFDRIEGTSGLPLLNAASEDWLRPLAALHRCRIDGITPCDPIRRIFPRLDLLTNPQLGDALDRLAPDTPQGQTLLHGDFHMGQLIKGADGKVWVVDLDDLCLGPPEADLGNLIANLATQPGLPADFPARLAHWRQRILDAWTVICAPPCMATLEHHLVLALIRRHLKLREAGRPDFETEIASWVTRAACQISPSGSAAYRG